MTVNKACRIEPPLRPTLADTSHTLQSVSHGLLIIEQ
jgi:hypothetical protein